MMQPLEELPWVPSHFTQSLHLLLEVLEARATNRIAVPYLSLDAPLQPAGNVPQLTNAAATKAAATN